MTAIIRFPADDAIFARLTERQRIANQAAERADWLRIARQVLRSADHHPPQVVRDACSVLETYGNGMDYLLADEALHALKLRERQQAHAAAKAAAVEAEAEETPVKIAMRYRPELLAVSAGMMLAVVVAVAFNAWVA